MENLAKAIIAVMKEVKGIEKSMNVGSGNYSYKGVSDYEVKQAYNKAMVKHGLCILPIEVKDNLTESNWMEGNRFKRNVFCTVTTKYLLLHTSGESQVLSGYGHGTDSGDKSAGKATTYALKYTLLYTFMTPTGKILDSDNDHSEELAAPKPKGKPPYPVEQYEKGAKGLYEGKCTIKDIEGKYTVSEACKKVLMVMVNNLNNQPHPTEEEAARNQDLKQEHGQ